jgi:CRISPR/Cas system CSM-associated protein Csm3 (group 7 of RAMP superfamily)
MNDRVFTARLVARSPLHVGSGDAGLATDLPLNRDAEGRWYVPGTQIAGRLREVATRLAPALGWDPCTALDGPEARRSTCTCRVCSLLGSRGQKLEAGDPEPGASALWCFDAPLEGAGTGASLVRDGVGIDRRSGGPAADAGALYDAEWIPAGAAFGLRLELARGAPRDAEDTLALALSEWAAGRGRVGGGAARGGGAFELEAMSFRRAELDTADGLLDFLRAPSPRERGREEPAWLKERTETLRAVVAPRAAGAGGGTPLPEAAVGHFAELSFELAFAGPVLVNDPAGALAHGVSFAPVVAGPGWTDPVLPGSSLRGVLRAQVERIARTVATHSGGADLAVRCPACDPFNRKKESALRSCADLAEAREKAGEEPPRECAACELFGSTRQGSRLWIEDSPLSNGPPTYRLRDFVAIDRFTGGALDGAKFDALPLYGARFRACLLLWNAKPCELGALALALRDLHDGLATLGAHGSKGFGRAAVEGVRLRVGRVRPGAPELAGMVEAAASGIFQVREWGGTGTAEELVAAARAAGWVKAFVEACGQLRRPFLQGVKLTDAYSGGEAKDLYPPFGGHTEPEEVVLGR